MVFRKALFWSHLAAGAIVALFVAFMALTGSIIAFEPQILRFSEQAALDGATTARRDCVSPGQAIAAAQQQFSRPIDSFELRFGASALRAGFGKDETYLVEACSGRVLDGSASPLRPALVLVRNLHESASVDHTRGGVMYEMKNAANVAFVFLIVSGIALWIPRKWRVQNLRAIATVRLALRGRALEWNLHNAFGFWFAVPLLAITVTGAIMSYSWAETLLYAASGTPSPARRDERAPRRESKPLGASEQMGEHPGREGKPGEGPKLSGHGDEHSPSLARALTPSEFTALDPAITSATQRVLVWQTLQVRLIGANAERVLFMFDQPEEDEKASKGRPAELLIDRKTGAELVWRPAEASSRGQQWRGYARILHTGEAFGIAGQAIALVASLTAVLLVWTGIALSLRRYLSWRKRMLRRAYAG